MPLPYTFSGSGNAIDNNILLSWTYPNQFTTPGSDSARPFPIGVTARLFLQRSVLAYNTVLSPLNFSTVSTGPPNTPIQGNPPNDSNWSTIKSWTGPDDFPVSSYLDTATSPCTAYVYRLILFTNASAEGLTALQEMDWNIVVVCTPCQLSAGQISGGTRLSWPAPDVSKLPGNFLQFISYVRCPCTTPDNVNSPYNRITVNSSSFTAPTTYDVYKSTDGTNFGSPVVVNAALNQYNEWYDSGITTPGGSPWYYKFIANRPSGPAITSNIIFAN